MNEEELFRRYITICNESLDKNKDKFPFNHILKAVQTSDIDPSSHVRIVDDMGNKEFGITLENNNVKLDKNTCGNKCGSCLNRCREHMWIVKTSYLNEVISHRDFYIENPALLNWEWLNNKNYL